MRTNVHFILVRPTYLGNIGSVARVLKNFGFKNLRLVAPPRNYKDAEARRMSVGAFDVLKEAHVFGNLGEALTDIHLAIGTTTGTQREHIPLSLLQTKIEIDNCPSSEQIGIVFGEERNGLLRDELDRCHRLATIPTDPNFPSLNVSQALGIVAYELSRDRQVPRDESSPAGPEAKSDNEESSRTSGATDDRFFADLDQFLYDIQFTRAYNRENILSEMRSLYQRARPTERELQLLTAILWRLKEKSSPVNQSND